MSTALGQLTTELTAMNPWWKTPKTWTRRDPDLRHAAASSLDYRPTALHDLRPGGLYLLRGPRRVGKTVTTKQAIASLLADGVPPLHVVRVAADGWDSSALRTVIQNVPLPPLADDRHRWWFLDEVTAVTGDWATQIKWLRDNHLEFGQATVVLTGSSAGALTAAAGVLAGRRGRVDHADRTLMPMGFRSFAAVWHPEITELPALPVEHLHTSRGQDAYQDAAAWLSDLLPLWELYLQYGGFPSAVAAAWAGQPVPAWFVDDLFSVLHRDAFTASQLDEAQTVSLVERLWASTSTPLNMSKIGDDLGIHHSVVQRHVEYLRDAYLLWACPQLDHEWVPRDRAQDKVYPVDPLIGRLAHLRSQQRPDLDTTVLAESQIGMALRRAGLIHGSSWTEDSTLFHLRTANRKEIDFVGENLGGAAIEGKYTDRGRWLREAATVNASPYRGILTTRNVFDTTDPQHAWAVPACLLAALTDT